jgi:autotransporter-associated beta strand protein
MGDGVGNANLPAITLNSGTTLSATRFNVLGNLTLNNATLTQASTDGGTFFGYEFLGTVSAGGGGVSLIATTNGAANHLGANTTFDVADATGSSAADLIISAPLRDRSGSFASAPGGLTKTGAGTLELSGTNLYTGTTTVQAGALLVSGNIASSAVTVSSGATLLGSGTVGALTVQSGGTLAPGASPGTLSVNGNATLNAGSTIAVEIGGAAQGQYDSINVTGSISLAGALSGALVGGYVPDPADRFWIGVNDLSDAVIGNFSNVPVTDLVMNSGIVTISGYEFTVYYSADFATNSFTGGNDILLAIPEPGSLAMVAGGIAMLASFQRARRFRRNG